MFLLREMLLSTSRPGGSRGMERVLVFALVDICDIMALFDLVVIGGKTNVAATTQVTIAWHD